MALERDILATAFADITNVTVTHSNEVEQLNHLGYNFTEASDYPGSYAVNTTPSNAKMTWPSLSNQISPSNCSINNTSELAPVTPEEATHYQELADIFNQQSSVEKVSPAEIAEVVQRLSPVQNPLPRKSVSPGHSSLRQQKCLNLAQSPVGKQLENTPPIPNQKPSFYGTLLENHYFTTTQQGKNAAQFNAPVSSTPGSSSHVTSAKMQGSMTLPVSQNYPSMAPPPAHSGAPVMPAPPMYHHMMSGYTPWQQFMTSHINNMYNPMPMMLKKNQDNMINSQSKPGTKLSPSNEQLDAEKQTKRARRNRTRITDVQQARLEALFEEDSHPDCYRREEIAREFGFRDEVIRVWFKNRRARAKKIAMKQQRIAAAIAGGKPTAVNCSPPQEVPTSYGYNTTTYSLSHSDSPYQPTNEQSFYYNMSTKNGPIAECYSPISSISSGGSHASSPVDIDDYSGIQSGYAFKPINDHFTQYPGYAS